MKLLTLNTHSLIEDNYRQKLSDFIVAVSRERPDVIALQEVNQKQNVAAVPKDKLGAYISCDPSAVIREGNHALAVAEGLHAFDLVYHWTWLPIKRGYLHYDEGVAILSRAPMEATDTVRISRVNDYKNWKTRKLLGARVGDVWFYSIHLGWWDDPEEPFPAQWAKVNAHMARRGQVFLMGDFNSPAETRGEGYDLVTRDGWTDTYTAASVRDNGITVSGRIAGWTHRDLPAEGARVDHIFCNFPCRVSSFRVVFNGENEPVVSDHFGVLVDIHPSSHEIEVLI
ncbi:MAG: endonuclease/exonuclease/phosphatase family protein [Clostridia bacterium]|nr:endonuclease/exonuclease/phosphatase family protein [Clostridia bacterium]